MCNGATSSRTVARTGPAWSVASIVTPRQLGTGSPLILSCDPTYVPSDSRSMRANSVGMGVCLLWCRLLAVWHCFRCGGDEQRCGEDEGGGDGLDAGHWCAPWYLLGFVTNSSAGAVTSEPTITTHQAQSQRGHASSGSTPPSQT